MVHYAGGKSYDIVARGLIIRYIGQPKSTTAPEWLENEMKWGDKGDPRPKPLRH